MSADPVDFNMDCFNMREIPNRNNTNALNILCNTLELEDPYRYLHYNKMEFTYSPRCVINKNRSRIDFFLVSSNTINKVTSCEIVNTLQNSLFDHKAIKLEFNKKVFNKLRKQKISNKILKSDILEILVYCAGAETYLQHRQNRFDNIYENKLLLVGEIKRNLINAGLSWDEKPGTAPDPELIRRRNNLINTARYQLQELNFEQVQNIDLEVEPDIFMEVLANNIRNEVCSYQAFYVKEKNAVFNAAVKRLTTLKSNFANNAEEIFALEKQLNDIRDAEMRSELENYAIFEYISAEKMSPKFLDLAKKGRSEAKLSEIKDDDGNVFASESEQKQYILNYFSNIYKRNPEINAYEGCIENFLGETICNKDKVRAAKVSPELRTALENDISITELDNAVEKLKNTSAGGPDGLSVPFVKKFWPVFRKPLWVYTAWCVNKGTLTHNFATASIKLIPKKGDTGTIKNWRPISLLNVLYKVIAKTLNERLNKVSDAVLTRSQKGFTEYRYIQECLINIIENVNYCNKNKVKGFVLALDQAKAFDSVNHAFMTEVYKFFGLGPQFIKMLNVLTTGRNACITWDDGSLSECFDLECGNAQGNAPSPKQFNFGQQILIFKIEFSPVLISIIMPRIPRAVVEMEPPQEQQNQPPQDGQLAQQHPLAEPVEPAPQQGETEDEKIEAFADDATAAGQAEEESVRGVKTILNDFYYLSGLKCNFDKSNIMLVGYDFDGPNPDPVPEWLHNSGFEPVTEIKVLGCIIDSKLTKLTSNFDMAIVKIRNTANFWGRFKLSLPGRIGVAKTLMLSQLSYLGCFLTPTEDQLRSVTQIIGNFIKGGLNVSMEKIFLEVKYGGVGMININDFLIAQQCTWLKKLNNGKDDIYKRTLAQYGYSIPGLAREVVTYENNPGIYGITKAFHTFYLEFLKVEGNIKKAPVLNNPLLKRNDTGTRLLDTDFFRRNIPPIQTNDLAGFTVDKLVTNGRLRSLDEINNFLPVQLSLVTYLRISESIRFWDKSVAPNTNTGTDTGISFANFQMRSKKGSKLYRNILSLTTKKKKESVLKKTLQNYLRVTSMNNHVEIDIGTGIEFFSWWNKGYANNRYKDFMFKFGHNLLGVNNRVANFNENINAGCTFCSLEKNFPVPVESFRHLFFDCPLTNKIHKSVEDRWLVGINAGDEAARGKLWLLGSYTTGNRKTSEFLNTVVGVIQWYIWECKLKKNKLSWSGCSAFGLENLSNMLKVSSRLRESMYNSNLDICRYWRRDGR
jgi:Reverse transcriptase (RNA-dependent DNA polymerase)